jgi:hypothetical protein
MLIQTNKFSDFSDDKSIFFSKIDLIKSVIPEIKEKNNDCVLIVGNGDLPFTNELEKLIPQNVVRIFAQNNLTNSDRVESLPLGIGNSEPCVKSGHGEHWEDVKEKVTLLNNISNKENNNFKIYCNFRDYTFPEHRSKIKNVVKNLEYIYVDESDLKYENFIEKILNTSCNICPAGNGLDTHRLWETLYCNRIPITFRVNETRSYKWVDNGQIGIYDDLYANLPIIILKNENELKDKNLIMDKFFEIKKNWKNIHLLDFNYWNNKIKKIIHL